MNLAPAQWPDGAKCIVAITIDWDGHSLEVGRGLEPVGIRAAGGYSARRGGRRAVWGRGGRLGRRGGGGCRGGGGGTGAVWGGGGGSRVVGRVPGCEGVWRACGFGAKAGLVAPACAEGLATRILGQGGGWFDDPACDPARSAISWQSRSR